LGCSLRHASIRDVVAPTDRHRFDSILDAVDSTDAVVEGIGAVGSRIVATIRLFRSLGPSSWICFLNGGRRFGG